MPDVINVFEATGSLFQREQMTQVDKIYEESVYFFPDFFLF